MTRAKTSALLALVAAFGSPTPCFAAEPTQDTSTAAVERCVEAHDNARVLMLEEEWLEAESEGRVDQAVYWGNWGYGVNYCPATGVNRPVDRPVNRPPNRPARVPR